jgi:hypothetical protein
MQGQHRYLGHNPQEQLGGSKARERPRHQRGGTRKAAKLVGTTSYLQMKHTHTHTTHAHTHIHTYTLEVVVVSFPPLCPSPGIVSCWTTSYLQMKHTHTHTTHAHTHIHTYTLEVVVVSFPPLCPSPGIVSCWKTMKARQRWHLSQPATHPNLC